LLNWACHQRSRGLGPVPDSQLLPGLPRPLLDGCRLVVFGPHRRALTRRRTPLASFPLANDPVRRRTGVSARASLPRGAHRSGSLGRNGVCRIQADALRALRVSSGSGLRRVGPTRPTSVVPLADRLSAQRAGRAISPQSALALCPPLSCTRWSDFVNRRARLAWRGALGQGAGLSRSCVGPRAPRTQLGTLWGHNRIASVGRCETTSVTALEVS